MVFGWDSGIYNSDNMQAFETGNPGIPAVFLTPDHRQVFVVTMGRWTGIEVHRADPAEIERLAAQYHLEQLLDAIQHQS